MKSLFIVASAQQFRLSLGKLRLSLLIGCILSPFILYQDQMKNEFIHGSDMCYAYYYLLIRQRGRNQHVQIWII